MCVVDHLLDCALESIRGAMSSDDDFMMDVESDGEDSFIGGEENNAVGRVQGVKAAAAATSKPPVLHASTNASTNASKKKKKPVEEMYQKKTQLEHILLRPDTYSKFEFLQSSEEQKLCMSSNSPPCCFSCLASFYTQSDQPRDTKT